MNAARSFGRFDAVVVAASRLRQVWLSAIAMLVSAVLSLPSALAAPGDVDVLNLNIVGSFVYASAVQPDGKTIIGGQFTSVLGQARNNIARLNADGTLDAGFNPNANSSVESIALQADGQILLGGSFTTIAGSPRNRIARVVANGTLDAGFSPNANGLVRSIAVQADGQILLGGDFTTVGGVTRNRIARLAANGTLDAGFNPSANATVYSIAIQADGQVLLGGSFITIGGSTRNRIARVAANGTLDASFTPNANFDVISIAVQADGQILFVGFFTLVNGVTRDRIARVAANGTLDMGFNPVPNSNVFSIALQADGRILFGGEFTSVGGTPRNRIARVAADGMLDLGFNPNVNGDVRNITLQADGQILLGDVFTTVGGSPRNRFARLLNDPATQSLSAVDTTQVLWTRGGSAPEIGQASFELSTNGGVSYTPLGGIATRVGSTANWQLTGLSLPSSGQLRARGRTTGGFGNGSTGLVEQVAVFSFGPGSVDALNLNIVGTQVLASAVQPDGKTIIAGTFSSVLGQTRNNIARLNADGTLDAFFNPNANGSVQSIALQADGQILLGGNFAIIGGSTRNRIARVAANGTLDAGFNPNANNVVTSIAVQADGQILLSGSFTNIAGSTRNNIARVAANGTLDAGFDPNANNIVLRIAVQSDGQILLGGSFTSVGGSTRNRIARVAANGTLDAGFNPNANNNVRSIAVQSDGQILLGGFFTSIGGTVRNHIARVAANGTLDAGFNPNANNTVSSIALQSDGQILLGGDFTTVGGSTRNRIARVAANGTLDAGFDPNADNFVSSIALQADGQILLGGAFTTVGGSPRNGFARLLNDPATQSLDATNATQVLWTRGGSAPDVSQTTFELSTNGGVNYTPLGGTASRVGTTSNWQLSGLSLPASGQLRARGRTTGGNYSGSTGLVEQVAVFSLADITSNLQARYACDGNALDSSGGLRHLGPSFGALSFAVDGRYGQACQFDGFTRVKSANSAFTQSNAVTYAYWIKKTTPRTGQETIMQTVTGAGTSNVQNSIDFETSPARQRIWSNNATFPFTISTVPSPTLFDSTWHHVAITSTGPSSSVQIYIDGAAVTPVTLMGSNNVADLATTFYLGARSDLLSNDLAVYQGAMDDVRIYSRVLTPLDILDLAAPPGIGDVADITINEDTSTGALSFSVNDLQTPASSLQVFASSSNPSLVPLPNITLGGTGNARTVSVMPAPNQSGTSIITLAVTDDDFRTSNIDFVLTVDPVNDAPTFTAGANQVVFEDAGPQSIPNWATALDDGDPDAVQALNFVVMPISGTVNFSVFPTVSPSGTLSYTSAPDSIGSASFSVRLDDNGGTANGGVDQSYPQIFTISVGPVNDAPTFTAGANQSVIEDAGPQSIPNWATALDDGDPDALQALNFVVTPISGTVNFSVFPTVSPSGTLSYTSAPNSVGSASFSVRLDDNGGTANGGVDQSADQTFTISVGPVNDAPTVTAISNLNINEDTTSAPIAFTINDEETPPGALAVVAGSDNPTLFPGANIVFGGSGANLTITITPAPNQFGVANFQVIVDDGQASSTSNFVVTVNAVNDAPTVTAISNLNINENTTSAPIAFTINDVETTPGALGLVAGSDNPTLFPGGNIVFGGSGANRTITITPAANEIGVANFQVIVDDGQASSTSNFVVTVNAVNDPPTIAALSNLSTSEDVATAPIAITLGDLDNPVASLTLSATSSNPSLVPLGNVVFGGTGANRSAVITPEPNQSGTATITVTVSDGTDTTSQNFTLTVTPVNDAPTIAALSNLSTSEDNATAPIAITLGDLDNPVASLTLSATSSNPSLVPIGNVVFSGAGANRTAVITPEPNQSGTATITVTVSDGTDTSVRTFTLTVNPVNDLPSFTAGPNQSLLFATNTAQTISNWATAITDGDPDFVQALSFNVSNSNNALFSVQPSIAANGTLSYTTTGAPGTSIVSVSLTDDATAGGQALSTTTITFSITVAVNTSPSLSAISAQSTNEDTTSAVIAFTVSDIETPVSALVVTALSSNTALIPLANIVFAGTGSNRSVSITPTANRSGTSTITLNLSDGTDNSSRSFVLTVNPINDLPSFIKGANQVIAPGITGAQSISNWASAIDDGDADFVQALSFNLSSDNPSLFASQPSVSAAGTLSFTPAGIAGIATVSISLTDDASAGGSGLTTAAQSFTITIQAVPIVSVEQRTPTSTVVGQPFTVRVRVRNPTGSLVPTGTMSVTPLPVGATVQCSLTAVATPPGSAEALCTNVISPIAAAKLVLAVYDGNPVFLVADASDTHAVDKASTQLRILEDLPDPSPSNTPVAVRYQLEVLAPSVAPLSSLNGIMTLSDGINQTSAPFSLSNPVISLVLQGDGPRVLTLRYSSDSNFLDSSATEVHTLTGGNSTDLAVTVSNGKRSVQSGGEAIYLISVRNLGGINSSAQLNAFVPNGLSNYRYTCSASAGSSCHAANGTGAIIAAVNVAAGGEVTYTVRADVLATEPASITHTALIVPAAMPPDTNPSNDVASDTDFVGLYSDGFEN